MRTKHKRAPRRAQEAPAGKIARRRAAATSTGDASLGDAQPAPIPNVEWDVKRAHGRLSAAFLNYRLPSGTLNRDDLSRLLAAEGWDRRWLAWNDLKQKRGDRDGAYHLSPEEWQQFSELFYFAHAGEQDRARVRAYRAQRAAAKEALARGDRSRALRLAGILGPNDRGHGGKYRPEHLAEYLDRRRRGSSPREAAEELCRRYHFKRAGLSEWLRLQRRATVAEFRGLQVQVAAVENTGTDRPLGERIKMQLRAMKKREFQELRGRRDQARRTVELLTPLPKP